MFFPKRSGFGSNRWVLTEVFFLLKLYFAVSLVVFLWKMTRHIFEVVMTQVIINEFVRILWENSEYGFYEDIQAMNVSAECSNPIRCLLVAMKYEYPPIIRVSSADCSNHRHLTLCFKRCPQNHAFLELMHCLKYDASRRKSIFLDLDTKPTMFEMIVQHCLAQLDTITVELSNWNRRDYEFTTKEAPGTYIFT